MHFRCRVWQAQILDVIHCVLLLQHHSDLYEVSRHKVATYDILSGFLLVIYCVELLYNRLLCRPFGTLVGRERSSCFTCGTLT